MLAMLLDRGLSWADGNVVLGSAYPHILTIPGEVHKRQRKAMNPAFSLTETKGLLPSFAESATKVRVSPRQSCISVDLASAQLADKWHESVETEGSGESLVTDVHSWFAKATLDAYVAPLLCYLLSHLKVHNGSNSIGAGAFDYDFGALDGADNALARTYANLLYASTPTPRKHSVVDDVS